MEVSFDASNDAVDTTAGSGTDWKSEAPGLNQNTVKISIMHDASTIQAYIQKLKPGQVVSIEYGPEGNTSGKPKHVQDFRLGKVSHKTDVKKSAVMHELEGSSTGAPSTDMYAGGVYS